MVNACWDAETRAYLKLSLHLFSIEACSVGVSGVSSVGVSGVSGVSSVGVSVLL